MLNKSVPRSYFKFAFYCALVIVSVLFLMPVPEQAGSNINDKFVHGLIFFVLAWLLSNAYPKALFFPVNAAMLAGYGLLIEIMQGFMVYRTFSWLDWGADVAGIVLCIGLSRFWLTE